MPTVEEPINQIFSAVQLNAIRNTVEKGQVDHSIMAVVAERGGDGKHSLVMLDNVFGKDGQPLRVDEAMLGRLSMAAQKKNKDVVMFILAVDGLSGTTAGMKPSVLVAGRHINGLFSVRMFLKNKDEADAHYSESSETQSKSWRQMKKPVTVVEKAGVTLLDKLWSEYTIINSVPGLYL